jgi:hypothetical protein
MLIRRPSRRAETQWRDGVTDQLAALKGEVATLTSLLTEDRKQRQPSPLAGDRATFVLVLSGVLVLLGIVVGTVASTEAASVSTHLAAASSASAQFRRALQSGPQPNATWIEAKVALVDRWYTSVQINTDDAESEQRAAAALGLAGPFLVAFGSALAGAVLGWMLTQWFRAPSGWPRFWRPKGESPT